MGALTVGNDREKDVKKPWNSNHDWSIPEKRGKLAIEDDACLPASPLGKLPVVSASDAERYVEGLREFDIKEVGSSAWMEQQRILSQLNLQAHRSVMERKDEYVVEALETYGKISVILHELLLIEAWNEFILPHLVMTERFQSGSISLRTYFVMYHEATLANFLEVILYHRHLCEELTGGLALEILDYCVRKVAELNSGTYLSPYWHQTNCKNKKEFKPGDVKGRVEAMLNCNPADDMRDRAETLNFRVCVTAVTIIRYLCEHMNVLPSNFHMRMLDVHDILMGIIPLLENPPWTKRLDTGKWEKFIDFEWQTVKPQDLLVLTKTEAQIWLIIYYFIMNEHCLQSYHLDTWRKSTMLRARKYLNNVLLDQLPVLVDVQRYLDEIAILDVSTAVGRKTSTLAGGVMVEEIAAIRSGLVKATLRIDEIIDVQLNGSDGGFSQDDCDSADLRKICNMYETDGVEAPFDATSMNR